MTVTATDGSGNVASVSRQVVVSAPPSDDDADDTPPVVIAPVIEARLAGKTLALNARVTLKAGQKCKGTITVTTAFGGKTYKAPAKLALKNGACRATAQITLKKTPSLRTKLRVTVGATKADKKKLSPRTITSRRG